MQLPEVKTFLGVSEQFIIDNDEVRKSQKKILSNSYVKLHAS